MIDGLFMYSFCTRSRNGRRCQAAAEKDLGEGVQRGYGQAMVIRAAGNCTLRLYSDKAHPKCTEIAFNSVTDR